MSLKILHLNKLLKVLYLSDKELVSVLRQDIREEKAETSEGGGDFYQPFWYDAKRHVLGIADLSEATQKRIADNYRRKNLYPLLEAGFLALWKRGDNQNVTLIPENPKGRMKIGSLDLTVKIENIMALDIGGQRRLAYPYWFQGPPLSEEAARVGLWMMAKALEGQSAETMRIFDVIRARYFSLETSALNGNEEKLLLTNYKRILKRREQLAEEYV